VVVRSNNVDCGIRWQPCTDLQAAVKAMSRQPQHFDMVVTGQDARLAKAAVGKQALLDLHAGTDDKWLLKVCGVEYNLTLRCTFCFLEDDVTKHCLLDRVTLCDDFMHVCSALCHAYSQD